MTEIFTNCQDWAGLDSMLSASRSAKLHSLQKMTEMQEFLEFIAEEGQSQTIFFGKKQQQRSSFTN